MTIRRRRAAGLAGLAVLAALSLGGPVARSEEIPLSERRSGFEAMSPQTQALQRDDTANPGMLSVLEGEALWGAKAGRAGRACADCHGDGGAMRGVAARYPAFDPARGGPITLDARINLCRTERQEAAPFGPESPEGLALQAFVAHQSRGLPIEAGDERLAASRERGRALFRLRQGQLNLSCAQCHDDNWGRRLGGAPIPQGHPTGYPLYRLEWQTIGSLARRLRNCLVGVRAEPFPPGSPELLDLEVYLAWRARGMAVETPAVRP
jgi:L-cysteine S-thiosulfotransferase